MDCNIVFEISPVEELTDALLDWVKEYFLKDLDEQFIDPVIETDIAKQVEILREDLYCVLEYPYVDKVYRDSYYNYYSSKHYSYQRDCIRVSLFKEEICKNDFLNLDSSERIINGYLGFFILRPTTSSIIGRSLISRDAIIDSDFSMIECEINSLVFGVKVQSSGFPHSSQDGESIKCAETTIWTIMEYFGNKYPEYKPVLPNMIRRSLERFSYQRQLPSNGLTMDQISFALKEFGFGTRIYSKEVYGESLFNIIDYYVESGIPVLAGLESGDLGHVIVIAGKKIEWGDCKNAVTDEFDGFGRTVNYFDFSDFNSLYVVQDDNLQPYNLIHLEKPGESYEDDEAKEYQIDSIVVPLYPKIYLEAYVARELLLQVLKDSFVGYDFGDNFVFRVFLASSRSFKNHISKLNSIDDVLKYNITAARMPKFIWCAEIYNKDEIIASKENSSAIGLIILDATEACNTSIDAFIFAGYPDRCISMSENNYVKINNKFENYLYFRNLK